MQEDDYMGIDLRKILYQVIQNIGTIALISLASAMIGYLIAAFLIKPTYSASAQMLVNNRRDETQSTAVISQSDINASSSLVSTYSIILKSHDVLERIIDDCDLSYSAETLSKMVSVSSVNSTQVMKITVTNGNAQEALNICADLVKLAPDAIINAIDAGSVTTVASPYTTGRQVAPSKRRYTMIAGLIGLLACLGFIVIREITNDKFKTTEDIRTVLDLNILGVIPEENSSTQQKTRNRKTRSRPKKGDTK